MNRRSRLRRYAACFVAGATVAGSGYALAAETITSGDTPARTAKTVSIRATGVGLPLIGAHGTVGAADYAPALRDYHDSGRYQADLAAVDRRARSYLGRRVKHLRKQARKRCRKVAAAKCKQPKLAMVLDIDETALSNYEELQATNFAGASAALSLSVIQSDSPAIAPTLKLYRYAQRKRVAVFFITGRPDSIAFVRPRTIDNLTSAGYSGWAGLSLNPDTAQGTVPYKAGERERIEQRGYRIVANVGDQESDLHGGHADRAFKLPNPFYFISD